MGRGSTPSRGRRCAAPAASKRTATTALPVGGASPEEASGAGAINAPAGATPQAGPTPRPTTGTGASRCAPSGGATDIGVTDTEVAIGNVSIISGAVPGFGRTSQAATQAYVDYVNSEGGVCGRRLRMIAGDDRFDSGANRSVTEQLKSKVFAFVGGLSVVDDGGALALQGTNVPDVGIALSDGRIKLPNNFSSAPIDLADGGNGFVPALRYYRSQGATRGAVIWPGQPIARGRAQGYVRDMQRAGINVVYTAESAVTETNYSGFAAQIQRNNVDVLVTALEVSAMASLARALRQQGYQPKFASYGPQAYGKQFLKLAGDAAEGVTINIAYDIIENRANNSAIGRMATWFARTNPGLDPDYFAVIAWGAAELFVTALRAAGGAPTRDRVLAELRKITAFDAGGVLAPNNPAGKRWANCFLIIKVEKGAWRRVDPVNQGYRCE